MSNPYRRVPASDLPIIPEVWAGQLAILAVVVALAGASLYLIMFCVGTGTCNLQALGEGVHGPVRYQIGHGCQRLDAAAGARVVLPTPQVAR
jgi:hypothetical protein